VIMIPDKVLLIDGMNLFIRCFCVVPTMDTNGNPTGGITGFLKSMKNMIRDSLADRVIVAWDGEGGSSRRRGILKEYKEGRKVRLNREYDFESPNESKQNLSDQLSKLKQFLELLGIIQVETPETEADDVIALICKSIYPDVQKVVLTSDRDMLQLIDDKTVVYSPTKKVYWTYFEMVDKMKILPENYIFVKALMGDNSDNVDGIKGIGEKTALKLFPFISEKPTSLEEIRQHCIANAKPATKYQSILDQWDRVLENVKLMQLSSPIISPNSARVIRISTLEQRPKFVFTEFKLELIRHGIQALEQDFFGVIQGYKHRAEATK